MGPDNMWWSGWWMFPFGMPILMLAVLAAVLYFIFGRGAYGPHRWRDSGRFPPNTGDSESAIEILGKRYAKGEITREEFEQMKKHLNA